MATAVQIRKAIPKQISGWNALRESMTADSGPKLNIDKEKGIIYGVRICGRYSKNCHGIEGVTEGSEYTRAAMESELPLLEGMKVRCDHPPRDNPKAPRSIFEGFGIIRNARIDNSAPEGFATIGDLHFKLTHEMAGSVIEDVERGLGMVGLSHNAKWAEAQVINGRFVITKIEAVESVDLVDKPATNTNLWEGREMKKFTMKSVLEARMSKLTPVRQKWAKRILEDASADPAMKAEADVPDTGAAAEDPDALMGAGFDAACTKIIKQAIAGEIDPTDAAKQIGKYLKTHRSLTAKDEPAEPAAEDEEPKKNDDDKKVKEGETCTPAEKKLKEELESLKAKDAVRTLCESEGYAPDALDVKAMMPLNEQERKLFIRKHKSGQPARVRSGGGQVQESQFDDEPKVPVGAAGDYAIFGRG